MVGLVDLAPAIETVSVRGKQVPVYGVSAKGIAYLLARFPELRALMAGREVAAEQLMAMGGDAVAAIIAAGCGYPGDPEAEKVFGLLPADTQADLLSPVLRLTMPQGVGPFVEKLGALGGILGAAPSTAAPATKSAKRSTTSSAPATTSDSSGNARLAS